MSGFVKRTMALAQEWLAENPPGQPLKVPRSHSGRMDDQMRDHITQTESVIKRARAAGLPGIEQAEAELRQKLVEFQASIDGIKEFDPATRDLTELLESRRVSPEDAEKAIKEYGAQFPEGAERDKKLTELFAAVLNEINTDRQFVMGKVEEFQKRQKGRAVELEREGQTLADKGIAATDELLPTETKLTPEQQEYNWNARIFQERQQNLTMACEIPVLIEQRAYEIARLIRGLMKS